MEPIIEPIVKQKKPNRKLLHRKVPARIQALLNPVIVECILVHLRKLPNVGPMDLLNLRLVHKTWSYTVLRLPPSVWIHWYVNCQSFYRASTRKESFYPKIRALWNMQDDPDGMKLLLNADADNKIKLEEIHDYKLPTYHKCKVCKRNLKCSRCFTKYKFMYNSLANGIKYY